MIILRPLSLSELTPIISNMKLPHLGSNAFISLNNRLNVRIKLNFIIYEIHYASQLLYVYICNKHAKDNIFRKNNRSMKHLRGIYKQRIILLGNKFYIYKIIICIFLVNLRYKNYSIKYLKLYVLHITVKISKDLL